jgi:hypothetical protein
MSSYFDDAARKHRGLPTIEARRAFAEKVVKRVANYLTYIAEHSPATHQQMVHDLWQKFDKAGVRKEWDEDGTFLIEDMHSLGHEIGSAVVPVKFHPRQRFGDSPNWPGHYGYEEVQP